MNGKILTEKGKILKRLVGHFNKLLNGVYNYISEQMIMVKMKISMVMIVMVISAMMI